MGTFPFVLIGIFIGLILVGILAVFVWKKNKEGKAKGIGYHVLFIMWIIFLPLGIIYEIVFFASGYESISYSRYCFCWYGAIISRD